MRALILLTMMLAPWWGANGQVSRSAPTPVRPLPSREAEPAAQTQLSPAPTEDPIAVLRLRIPARGSSPEVEAVSAGPRPELTPEEKLAIAQAASFAVTSAETPIRLTASRTRVPNRAALSLSGGELAALPEPDKDGVITLWPGGHLVMHLRFPITGKPHLLDCLAAARQPGVPLTVVIEVGAGWGKPEPVKKFGMAPGWQHIKALVLPEKPGAHRIVLRSEKMMGTPNAVDIGYCEITSFK